LQSKLQTQLTTVEHLQKTSSDANKQEFEQKLIILQNDKLILQIQFKELQEDYAHTIKEKEKLNELFDELEFNLASLKAKYEVLRAEHTQSEHISRIQQHKWEEKAKEWEDRQDRTNKLYVKLQEKYKKAENQVDELQVTIYNDHTLLCIYTYLVYVNLFRQRVRNNVKILKNPSVGLYFC